MTTYVWRDGCFRDKRTNEPMPIPERAEICAPMVISDIEPHEGPNGKWITSRSEQRRVMAETGTCPWEPLTDRPRGTSRDAKEQQQGWIAEQRAKFERNELLKPKPIDPETKRKVRKAQAEVLSKHGMSA